MNNGGDYEASATARVLIVEDEGALRSAISGYLRAHGFRVQEASCHAEARRVLVASPIDAVVLDHRVPDGEALDLLPDIFACTPRPVVIVLTAYGTIDLAVRSVKEGVQQFLTKPVELATLVRELKQYLAQRTSVASPATSASARKAAASSAVATPLFGVSDASRRLHDQVARLRNTDAPLLILGETGTGKSMVGRYLHATSPRSDGPFVEVNCTAFSRDLVEAELFGVERGAFTGAYASKPGLLTAANRGTLFLDEIGDVDLGVQAKLLKVIEDKRFRRVGDVTERTVDVRIIAATNRDLAAAMREGSFRSDLYFRVATVTLAVPPLRDRPSDIVLLARQFLDILSVNLRRPSARLTEEAERVLTNYMWPGNVRELKNCLERALIFGDGMVIREADLELGSRASPPPPPISDKALKPLEGMEVEQICRALAGTHGRVDAAAVELEMARSTLYERIRRYGIDLSEFRRRNS